MTACKGCNSEFPLGHPNRRYCSEPCRQATKNRLRVARQTPADLARKREREARRRVTDGDRIRAQVRARRLVPEVAEARKTSRRESYRRHREQRIQDSVNWQRNNPDRVALRYARRKARERGHRVTPHDLMRQVTRQSGRCAYCQVVLSPQGRSKPTSLQWDHVVPLSRGGVHSGGNLVAACRDCNLKKGSKFVTEWRAVKRLEAGE